MAGLAVRPPLLGMTRTFSSRRPMSKKPSADYPRGGLWQNKLGELTMMLRSFFVAAAGVIACSHARAAEKAMPINFIGEWCYSSQENKTTSYTLPSWTEDGHCTKILSIDQYGFFGEGRHCEPVNMRLTTDTAPSGTAYIATVTARCQPDGPVTAGKLQTFEFNRYKGNLTVTLK
jgi:hypothetical protein